MLRTYPRLRQEQFIFHCFNFPKSRKSELHNVLHGIRVRVKVFSFNTFLLWIWSIIRFHCTCTIHLYGNYNHCLILSICSLKVIRFPLLKLENIRKNISWLKLLLRDFIPANVVNFWFALIFIDGLALDSS